MIKYSIKINNIDFVVNRNLNIIQACSNFNIDIPRFCYHEKLSIAGNCRMCLVEVQGISKPVASCALPVSDKINLYTNSKLVKKAREGILEFILINHPLDCPICDQGGECDLQDQSLIFGGDKGRFYENKRSVIEKNWGFFIKTIMTRCIHCTRCVRFIDEIAGFKYLGLIGRGNSMEIFNFSNKPVISELSGNLIDLCPVGALTSKIYSFIARPWELKNFKTLDLNDSMHSNIRIDVRDSSVLRVLPLSNENLNENWITDMTRFGFDGFKYNRLTYPLLKKQDLFIIQSWLDIYNFLKLKIKGKKINFILGNFIDFETILLLKKISVKYGNYTFNCNINNNLNYFLNIDFRKNYIFNISINEIKKYKNIFLFGLNLRLENPILNIKFKFFVDNLYLNLFNMSTSFNINYFSYNFNNNIIDFLNILYGKSFLNNLIFSSKKNLFIFGENFLNVFKNNFVFSDFFYYLKDKVNFVFLNYNYLNIINNDINLEYTINNFMDNTFKFLNYINQVIYSININSFFFNFKQDNIYIYQGHHNIKNIKDFDILLPTLTYVEKKSNWYLNFFGLIQSVNSCLKNINKNIKTDYAIFYNLFINLLNLNIDNYSIESSKYNFLSLNYIFYNIFYKTYNYSKFSFNNIKLNGYITNIYRLNQILRASLTLLTYYKNIKNKYTNFI